jgi:hypothetical protein
MPSTDNQLTAARGLRAVAEELGHRGVTAAEVQRGNVTLLEILRPGDNRRVHLRVRTRTGGSWQGSIRDGNPDPPPPHPDTYWVFVSLNAALPSDFFVVPDQWIRKDIHEAHQEYLTRNGGERPVTPNSLHHSIPQKRIQQWQNRWDLLGV